MRVHATMANNFLLGKFEKKGLQSLINDYLQVGCIKDLEFEEDKKDEVANARVPSIDILVLTFSGQCDLLELDGLFPFLLFC